MARIKKQQLFKFQPFSIKQKKVLTWWLDNSPVYQSEGIIADGAIRSGKTVSMSLAFIIWAMTTFNHQNFAMCGKTIGSFNRNVLKFLLVMLDARGFSYYYHRTDNLLEIRKGNVTNDFYIFGGRDESSQDLIQGITLAGIFFDEVALMPESFVNQGTGRCSVTGSKWWFNCNPDSPYHWFKTSWIDKAQEKKLVYLHFDMDDNLSLAENIKARYRSQYHGVFYQRYIQGLWTIAEGIVYDMFRKEEHVVNELPELVPKYKYVSVDYGMQNATVFLLWERDITGKYYLTREYYYSGRDEHVQKTNSEYADDFETWLGDTKIDKIIIDPSASSFIAELKKRGYQIKKARNNVLEGIRFVGTLLNLNKIAVHEDCKNTLKEFHSYVWDEKASLHGEDKPMKQHDHAMDALRYFCFTVLFKTGGMEVWK